MYTIGFPPDTLHNFHRHYMQTNSTPNADAFSQLQVALNAIAEYEKVDYLAALSAAPSLVLTESDPLRFLRYTRFDVIAAAQNLVLYWRRRREVFGERAFLPITLCGNGALTPEDIEFIQGGSRAFLPNDANGRPVLCIDPSRKIDANIQKTLRTAFFTGQVISENPVAQTDGAVVLVLVNALEMDRTAPQLHAAILDAFPFDAKEFHVFNCLPNWPKNCLLQMFANHAVTVFEYLLRNYRTYIHASQDTDQIIQSLERHGLTESGLPSKLGGTWSYEVHFAQWISNRLRMDRELYAATVAGATVGVTTGAVAGATAGAIEGAQLARTAADGPSEADDTAFQICRQHLDVAMQELSLEERSAYSRALRLAPPAILNEAFTVEAYLQVERYNATAAAKRLANYWQLRSDTFESKCFEAMNQTGEGTLRRKDLAMLGTGFVTLLPNDVHGCPVIFIDGARLDESAAANRNRCLFYMFSLLAENDKAQTDGAVFIYKLETPPFQSIDISFLERLVNSLPLRFKSIHIMAVASGVDENVASYLTFADRTYIHVGESKHALGAKLEDFGLGKKSRPRCFNGDWGYSKFVQWQELRTRIEWNIPMFLSGRECEGFPGLKAYAEIEDKVERKRRMNVIHCRRKRDRMNVEADLLREQQEELQDEQDELLRKNRTLENLLNEANKFTDFAWDRDQQKMAAESTSRQSAPMEGNNLADFAADDRKMPFAYAYKTNDGLLDGRKGGHY